MSGRPLRVGFVADWSPTRAPGLARYASELLSALRGGANALDITEMGRRRSGAVRLAWTQAVLPARLARLRPDVCHLTGYPAPLAWRGPTVLTLHDVSLLRAPATHPWARVAVMSPLLRHAVRQATAVIVPSRATADDAMKLLGVDASRIHHIPEAPASIFRRVTDEARLADLARRHRLEPGYLLALGTREPRKNLSRLVDAWLRLRADGWNGQLVLAGPDGWRSGPLDARLAELAIAGPVRRLGHVPDDDLPTLLSLAGAFAYPSLLEGFGLPVVEALACGVPTVTSDRGATAEIAGDAALLVDPTDVPAMAGALARALTPGPERDRLVAAGPCRAAAFTWAAAADATARVYRIAAGGDR